MIELVLVIGLCLLIYVLRRRNNPLDAVPGPRAYPLVGNALQLDIEKLFLQLTALGKEYGGVMKLYLFNEPVVVVSDTNLIHEVLVSRTADFAGRPYSFSNQMIADHLGSISFADAGPAHKERRQNIQKYLKQFGSGIQRIEDVTQTATDDLIQRLADTSGSPVDVSELIVHCVADVIVILLIGDTVSSKEIQFIRETLDKSSDAAKAGNNVLLDKFPWLRFLGNEAYSLLNETIEGMDKIICGFMDRKPENGYVNHVQSMNEKELQQKFLLSTRDQTASVWEFLAAGAYTTSTTLTSLMNVLCHYPHVQNMIRREIMDVIGPSRHPTLKDQHAMPYLRATILEIGRFISLLPISIPHKATRTCLLAGYTIPKDTQVWVNLWAMHHDDTLWDEPFTFRPERFLDASGELVLADHPNRKNLMPFSAGHRVCVGEVLAVSRMFLIIARILQNFSILPESTVDQQPSCDPRDMKMTLVNLPPPFKVRLVEIPSSENH